MSRVHTIPPGHPLPVRSSGKRTKRLADAAKRACRAFLIFLQLWNRFLGQLQDEGLLGLRASLGTMFLIYGLRKLSEEWTRWEQMDTPAAHWDIDFFPARWGLVVTAA